MTAHQVTAQRCRRREGTLDVDRMAHPQLADGGAGKGFRRHVGVKAPGGERAGGQTDTIDGHGIANREGSVFENISIDAQAPVGTMLLERANTANGFDDTREHARIMDNRG